MLVCIFRTEARQLLRASPRCAKSSHLDPGQPARKRLGHPHGSIPAWEQAEILQIADVEAWGTTAGAQKRPSTRPGTISGRL